MFRLSKNRSSLYFMFGVFLLVLAFLCPHVVLADDKSGLSGLEGNIKAAGTSILGILKICATIAGVGFILTSLFKFDQHKKNPTQIPMGQPLTLLVIGACLLVLPYIVNTLQSTIGGDDGAKQNMPTLDPGSNQ